ncbi:hypothetical protein V6N13_124974 [Hibiscus sabdariffa]
MKLRISVGTSFTLEAMFIVQTAMVSDCPWLNACFDERPTAVVSLERRSGELRSPEAGAVEPGTVECEEGWNF